MRLRCPLVSAVEVLGADDGWRGATLELSSSEMMIGLFIVRPRCSICVEIGSNNILIIIMFPLAGISAPPVKEKSRLGRLVWGVGFITHIMATEFIQTPKNLFSRNLFSNFTVNSTANSVNSTACQRRLLSSDLTCVWDKCDSD